MSERTHQGRSRHSSVVALLSLLLALGLVSLLEQEWSTTWSRMDRTGSRLTTATTNIKKEEEIPGTVPPLTEEPLVLHGNTSVPTLSLEIDSSSTDTSNRTTTTASIGPVVFPVWDKSFPCFPTDRYWRKQYVQSSPAKTGLLYVKPFKTGSSTSSGIALRMARNAARRHRVREMCHARFGHGPSKFPAHALFQNRKSDQSFLWTIVREPTDRAVSMFFHFEVSRHKVEPTLANFKHFLVGKEAHRKKDYYLKTLWTAGHFDRTTKDPYQAANEILAEYDFVGVTERMDESAVALKMILNVPMADVLYLSAKSKGSYDGGGAVDRCTYIWPSFVTPEMQEFLESENWKDIVQYDELFHQAVNASLDKTIDKLGREVFESELSIFREAQERVKVQCASDAVFPCDQEGRFHSPSETDCLWKDSGCATSCLDQVASELELW